MLFRSNPVGPSLYQSLAILEKEKKAMQRIEIKKVEFSPTEDSGLYPYFIVAESVLPQFTEFLKIKGVSHQPPRQFITASEELFELELPSSSNEMEMGKLCDEFLSTI